MNPAVTKPVGPGYAKLIKRLPLRKISNNDELAQADALADELWSREDLDDDENSYLDVLNLLIRNYERDIHRFPVKAMSPREMLIFLLEANEMKPVDLCKLLAISSGRASEILCGTRALSRMQIAIIVERFSVDAAAFLPTPRANSAGGRRK